MKYFKLKVISKNKESLIYFYNYLFTKKEDQPMNFSMLKKNFKFKNSKNRLTILKAPHVYKTAQEQFEISHYQEQYLIKANNCEKFFKFIKKLKTEKFSHLTILLKHYIKNNNQKFYKSFTSLNYELKTFKKNNFKHILNFKKNCNKHYKMSKVMTYLTKIDLLKEYKI